MILYANSKLDQKGLELKVSTLQVSQVHVTWQEEGLLQN